MKTIKILSLLLALAVVTSLNAQDTDSNDQMKLLFPKKDNPNKKMANGGYGSFSVGYTQINDQAAMIIGGRAAWIADHHFALGIAGAGFFSSIDNSYNYYENPSEYYLAGGYGGLLIEPIVAPNYPVHVSFPILIGGGGVTAANWNYSNYNYNYNQYYYNVDGYFVFEPGVDVEFNVVKFFRVALGVSYRLTSDIYLQYKYFDDNNVEQVVNVPTDALNSFNYNITFKFGWF
ncbi:MAG TPA: hypothetical protein VIN10_12060 [Bacteroidales bacterium]